MTTSSLPRRLLMPLAVLALGATSLLVAPTSQAALATAERATVTGADLPQTVRAARVYPHLEGGTRELQRADRLEIAAADCRTQGRGVPATSARFASYVEADGERPFFQGHEDPTFVVYEFASPERARRAMLEVVDYADRCVGRKTFAGSAKTLTRITVPRLGQREIGWRTVLVEGAIVHHDLEIYVRQGNRIERTWIQVDERAADRDRAIRSARILADVSRR